MADDGVITKNKADLVVELVEDGYSVAEAVRKVARKYGINEKTLRSQYYRSCPKQKGHPDKKLSPEQETSLLITLVAFSENNEGLTPREVIKVVKDGYGIDVSRTWVHRFLEKNKEQIRRRKPMVCSKARNKVADDTLIFRYVNSLLRMHAITSFGPHQIVNYDESRLYVGPDCIKYSRILEASWKMKPQKVVDSGKSETGSVLPFITASGEIVFVAVVTKPLGERSTISISEELGANSRTTVPHKVYYTDTSYVNSDLFERILNDFAKEWEARYPGLHCLVIGDNLSVHEDIDMRNKMLGRGLHMLFLPPNTTHWSQPLDIILFGLLKKAARTLVTNRNYINRLSSTKTTYSLVEVALRAIQSAFTQKAIRKAFRESGVWPVDANKILAHVGVLLHDILYQNAPARGRQRMDGVRILRLHVDVQGLFYR